MSKTTTCEQAHQKLEQGCNNRVDWFAARLMEGGFKPNDEFANELYGSIDSTIELIKEVSTKMKEQCPVKKFGTKAVRQLA